MILMEPLESSNAVEHEVVALCAYPCLVGVKVGNTLVKRHCERVVHSEPLAGFLVVLEERELHDPQEVPALRDNVELLCDLETECAEHGERYLVLICNDEGNVALLAAESPEDSLKLALAHELCEGAVRSVVYPSYVSETLRADSAYEFGLLVDLLAGELRSGALCNDTADGAAVCNSVLEYGESAVLYDIGDVGYLHAEAGIRLIGAVTGP